MNQQNKSVISAGPMLNAYPDSMGGTLGSIIELLQTPDFQNVFQAFYVLPSIFNTDLDRGFSVIDYELNDSYAEQKDLDAIKEMNMALKLDFILNHASVLSKQFQDILKNGENSKYKDFFINWNKFWEGHGSMIEEGYIQPEEALIKNMFFRKPGLPILNVRMPDGKEVPYWNTFYQEVKYPNIGVQQLMRGMDIQYCLAERLAERVNASLNEGKQPKEIDFAGMERYREKVIGLLEANREYLGQMDLNIKSPLVWEFYEDTLKKQRGYGAEIVRLDAFAYAPKEPGEKNFLNDPGTWELLKRIKELADQYELTLLPEIHSKYEEKIHERLAKEGYMTYDFFLPGLIIDALDRQTNEYLLHWAKELKEKDIRVVNMLGCHDGIPLLDLKGLIPDETIEELIRTVVARGGYVKDLHGKKNVYYQVNSTYYSALGEDDRKLLLARAIQLFMPGKPQVWYLDLFAGKNDYEAVQRAGAAGHKEINRTNLSLETIKQEMKRDIVQQQFSMLRFRNTFPAFGFDAELQILNSKSHVIKVRWEKHGFSATLEADLKTLSFDIIATYPEGGIIHW
jgi:sucrose phosphorylase